MVTMILPFSRNKTVSPRTWILPTTGWLFACLTVSAIAAPTRTERRCGWFENPTPANATLTDRDGVWEIATQGGYQANGDWPRFDDAQWVRTNRHHGYGCACITADVDARDRRLDNLRRASSRPLEVCREDRYLREPERP
ncbi:DUF4087 domain-containing protein [Pseudoxanthomonas beigongshangi]